MVGGQAVNLWALHYLATFPALGAYAPFTSKDIDFFNNRTAAEQLADAIDGELHLPGPDDMTPSAALVIGSLKGRRIEVDFMRAIVGVDDASIKGKFVTLVGANPIDGTPVSIPVMHPLDCLRSRLANINVLKRTDELSVRQAQVSILVLERFIAELLSRKTRERSRHAQGTLHDLEYVIRNDHKGQPSHLDPGISLRPETVLCRFLGDEGLDARWREKVLTKALARTENGLTRSYQRYAEGYQLAKATRQSERDQKLSSPKAAS